MEDETAREETGHLLSNAEVKKMKTNILYPSLPQD